MYEQLRGAITEAEDLKNEAYEETRRRQKAERDLLEASKKVKEIRYWQFILKGAISDLHKKFQICNIFRSYTK